MKETNDLSSGWKIPDIRWKPVGLGYAVGLLSTLVAGLPLLVIMGNSWLMALAGSIGLFIGGLVTGRRVGPSLSLVNGALMAMLYNLTVSILFFIGSFLQVLPEPLPGLPQGDSTFFFAWPLGQFVIGIFSAILGSRLHSSSPRSKV
ncbi:MAG: hypothetical protein Q8O55_00300 [Dehalococcoidales bacterium]|nr:hypothetical protein [Dehalococcoidales bacterium]